ncbi:MAG: hypothetical protein DRQ60_07365 [Gammaproteobacteria bacterium]|nr:MAG: hypothetical protein DRQ60_07365 [Gammaproteobacteria bacterium]
MKLVARFTVLLMLLLIIGSLTTSYRIIDLPGMLESNQTDHAEFGGAPSQANEATPWQTSGGQMLPTKQETPAVIVKHHRWQDSRGKWQLSKTAPAGPSEIVYVNENARQGEALPTIEQRHQPSESTAKPEVNLLTGVAGLPEAIENARAAVQFSSERRALEGQTLKELHRSTIQEPTK